MAILLGMMACGYLSGRKGLITPEGGKAITNLIVYVTNPFLIISGVFGKEIAFSTDLLGENLILVLAMFVGLIALSYVICPLFRAGKEDTRTYQSMLIFSNMGFMGIPLISALYGEAETIFITFYIVIYNILIYSFGICLMGGEMKPKGLLNAGMVACIIAIALFFFQPDLPEPLVDFVDGMSGAAVPLSMMAIGYALSRRSLLGLVRDKGLLLFCLVRLVIIPIICAQLAKFLPFDPMVVTIFVLMMAMPVGSMVPMLEQTYGKGTGLAADGVALTSILSVVTIPLVALTM